MPRESIEATMNGPVPIARAALYALAEICGGAMPLNRCLAMMPMRRARGNAALGARSVNTTWLSLARATPSWRQNAAPGRLYSGSCKTRNVKITSSAVKGSPSAHLTPSRSVKV